MRSCLSVHWYSVFFFVVVVVLVLAAFAFVNFYHQNGATGALSAHISMRGRRLYVKEKPPKVVTLSGRQIPGSQRGQWNSISLLLCV